ncbi:MAG: kelch repeat-containing protein, partial [Anaeromyxobacteraceae bacterium]
LVDEATGAVLATAGLAVPCSATGPESLSHSCVGITVEVGALGLSLPAGVDVADLVVRLNYLGSASHSASTVTTPLRVSRVGGGTRPAPWVTTQVGPGGAGLGATVTLSASVSTEPGLPPPTGFVTFRNVDTGATLAYAAVSRSCDAGSGEVCADAVTATDVAGLGVPVVDASASWRIQATYEGDGAYRPSADWGWADLRVHRKGQWHASASTYGQAYVGSVGIGGKVYTFGGGRSTAIMEYDPATDGMNAIANLPYFATRTVAAAPNGKAYALARFQPFAEFDPATGAVTQLGTGFTGTEHGGAAAVGLPDGRILVVGGWSSDGPVVPSVEAFDTNTLDTAAAQFPAMPTARGGCGAAYADGKVYVVGGEDDAGNPLPTVEILDVATGTWSTGPSLATPRSYPAVTALNGKVYAIGGHGSATAFEAVEVLDGAAPTAWTPGPGIQVPRTGAGAAALSWNGAIFLVGGQPFTATSVPVEVLFP